MPSRVGRRRFRGTRLTLTARPLRKKKSPTRFLPAQAPVGADDADDTDDKRKSISDDLFGAYGTPFSRQSKKQTTVATSTAEAELVTALYSTLLHQPTGEVDQTITRRAGYPSFQTVGDLLRQHCCHRHREGYFNARQVEAFRCQATQVRELVEHNTIDISFCKSENNLADFLTKRLSKKAYHAATLRLGFDEPMSSPDPNVEAPNTPVAGTSNRSDAPGT